MPDFDLDLFTIGGGSGGVRASRMSASAGARVALAEPARLGGTCVNVGCIPKKLFSYAAHFAEDFEAARAFGWRAEAPSFDWQTLLANKDREITRLNGVYERLLVQAGVEIVRARARVVDAHTVEAGGRRWTARHILVATGAKVRRPAIPGAELGLVSDDMFSLPSLPMNALVIGGGYIAVEFASILNGLGVATALACRGERLLRGFDVELADALAAEMRKKGVAVHPGSAPSRVERVRHGTLAVEFSSGERLEAGLVLFATGRTPNSAGLGLEESGVKLGPNGQVVVDRFLATNLPSIHAIGDVTDRLNLTPVATAEGMAIAKTLFGGVPTAPDHENVPTAVFGNPNLAAVGLDEASARLRYGAIDIYRTGFRSLRDTLGASESRVFMKLVVDRASQRVVGAHMLGPEAGEIIQGIAIAVKLGATKAQFDATIGIHPTVAEEFVTLREASA